MTTFSSSLQSSIEPSSSNWSTSNLHPPVNFGADDLARLLNTAMVSTRDQGSRDWMAEIQKMMETPAFRSLLSSIRHLARSQGISEIAAAEEMVRMIRHLDSAWRDYVFQEGLERLKSSG